MKKKILVLTFMCLAMITGCSDNSGKLKDDATTNNVEINESKEEYFTSFPSELADGEYIVCAVENNQEILKDYTMNASVTFHIFSKEELKDEDVVVKLDSKNSYTLIRKEAVKNEGKFDQNVCMLYGNIDWIKLRELQLNVTSEEFEKKMSGIDEQYEKLSDDSFPEFYDSEYKVQFDITDNFVSEELSKMIVEIKGKDYDIDFGRLIFNDKYEIGEVNYDACGFTGIGRVEYNIYPNREGCISLSTYGLEVNENIIIKNIRLVNTFDSVSLDKVEIEYEVDDNIINQIWTKGKDIALFSGDSVTISFEINDKNLSNKILYGANFYIEVEYECDGKMYGTHTQALCYTKHSGQLLYGICKDSIDVEEYFFDYLAE